MSVATMCEPTPQTQTRADRPRWITLAAARRRLGQSERFVLTQAMMGKIRTLIGPTTRYFHPDVETLAKQIYGE